MAIDRVTQFAVKFITQLDGQTAEKREAQEALLELVLVYVTERTGAAGA